MTQPDSHTENQDGDRQRCKGVRVAERAHSESRASPGEAQPCQHRQRRPDVRSKVERIGGQSRRSSARGHRAELPGTPKIHADREKQHGNRQQRVVQLHRAEKDTLHRLPDDPGAGDSHQPRLAEGGEILNLAVAVGMILVCRLVAHLHGEVGQRRGDQVESGMGRVGKHAQRPGEQAGGELEQRHCRRSRHRIPRDLPLFRGERGKTRQGRFGRP